MYLSLVFDGYATLHHSCSHSLCCPFPPEVSRVHYTQTHAHTSFSFYCCNLSAYIVAFNIEITDERKNCMHCGQDESIKHHGNYIWKIQMWFTASLNTFFLLSSTPLPTPLSLLIMFGWAFSTHSLSSIFYFETITSKKKEAAVHQSCFTHVFLLYSAPQKYRDTNIQCEIKETNWYPSSYIYKQ